VVALVGRYRDTLARIDDRWRFRRRETLLDIPYGIDPVAGIGGDGR
jgi:hypothetical protein